MPYIRFPPFADRITRAVARRGIAGHFTGSVSTSLLKFLRTRVGEYATAQVLILVAGGRIGGGDEGLVLTDFLIHFLRRGILSSKDRDNLTVFPLSTVACFSP